MPSPFPGMNPFLEQSDAWQDFHDSFIPAIRDAVSPQVSPAFLVKIEEHLYIHELSVEQRLRLGNADVSVSRNPGAGTGAATAQAVHDAPARILLPAVEFEKQLFLEIRDRHNRELVTVIEVLSPSNKQPGPDREQYLAKRGNLLRGKVHLVEIDFLRAVPRLPLEQAPHSDYYVMVSRAEERPEAEFWPLMLREPLPVVPIPLRPPWPDAHVNLQEILHIVYDRAYYKDYIYSHSPEPPLGAEDAAWAAALLAAINPIPAF
jgi:Protein of unknown function (DUF4058)